MGLSGIQKWTFLYPYKVGLSGMGLSGIGPFWPGTQAPYGVFFTKNRTILRRPAGGRKNRTIFYHFLDIVRYLVMFRHYLKFHGARTAFGRVIEGKMTSAGHRTAFAHIGRAPDNFLFRIQIVRFQRCPSGHRTVPGRGHCTMSDKRQKLSKISYQIDRCMPVRAPDDARPGAGRCDMSQTATDEKRRVFAEVHIAFT